MIHNRRSLFRIDRWRIARRWHRKRLLRHLRRSRPTVLVSTVLAQRDIDRIYVLARELRISVEETVTRCVYGGLRVCEQEANGDVDAPPRSGLRLKRGAW